MFYTSYPTPFIALTFVNWSRSYHHLLFLMLKVAFFYKQTTMLVGSLYVSATHNKRALHSQLDPAEPCSAHACMRKVGDKLQKVKLQLSPVVLVLIATSVLGLLMLAIPHIVNAFNSLGLHKNLHFGFIFPTYCFMFD